MLVGVSVEGIEVSQMTREVTSVYLRHCVPAAARFGPVLGFVCECQRPDR